MNREKLNAMKLLLKEYKELRDNPLTSLGVTVGLEEERNIFSWRLSLIGASDSPYERGLFFLKIDFPENYPELAPKIYFLTPIYHPKLRICEF